MAKLVVQDSWIAYNPIEGCTGNCIYCFQKPKKLTATTMKVLYSDVKREYQEVVEYHRKYYENRKNCAGKSMITPIAIGTETDMFSKGNIQFLYDFLDIHVEAKNEIPIVIITKQQIDIEFIKRYANVKFMIFIFVSASLLPKDYELGNATTEMRLEAVKTARVYIDENDVHNIKLIHNWRPFINTELYKDREEFLHDIKGMFDCSVLIGLRITNAMSKEILNDEENALYPIAKRKLKEDAHYFDSDAKEILDYSLQEVFMDAKDYPVFRNSSCALSYLCDCVDYTGTMWREDICKETICPEKCQKRCLEFKNNWDDDVLADFCDSYQRRDDCIEIRFDIANYEEVIAWTHKYGIPVFAPNKYQKQEWYCGNYRYYSNKYYE